MISVGQTPANQAEIGTAYQFTISFFKKCQLQFSTPAWNTWNINDQEQIEQLELGMAKVIADFRAQAEEVGKRRAAGHTTGFAKSVLLDAWGFCRYLSEGHGKNVDFCFKSGFQIFFFVL